MMELVACILPERGKSLAGFCGVGDGLADACTSDGNIRYFEYENDKFEFLSEYKSGDPQRGIAFVPKRGINVGCLLTGGAATGMRG